MFEQVSELLLLRTEVPGGGLGRLDFERNALDDTQARLLHRAKLQRVVRAHADFAQAEVEEHFGALPVLLRTYGEAEALVRLDRFRALVLQRVAGSTLFDSATLSL